MRAAPPVIGAVVFLGIGLGLIFGYCHGTTSFSFAYPLSGSLLHVDFTTGGPAVLGGMICTAIGVFLLIWAFFAAFADLFTRGELTRGRVERYSVVPTAQGTTYTETPVVEQRKHFWSRPSSRTHI
jgi:hypothetical protein